MTAQSRSLFVGIGVSEYAVHGSLPCAVVDVADVGALVGFGHRPALVNPTKAAAECFLQACQNSLPDGGVAVFLWSGHGKLPAGRLRLMVSDDNTWPNGIAFTEAVLPVALSGADRLLFIVDVCHSGAAAQAADEIQQLLAEKPPDANSVCVGVLASCAAAETARDGEFGQALRRLLRQGPTATGVDADQLRVRHWSVRDARVTTAAVFLALQSEWTRDAQRLFFREDRVGHDPALDLAATAIFPNPRYIADAPAVVVEHLLQAARGGASDVEISAFTGRVAEVNEVVSWVVSGTSGLSVVTGPAGTGKSAIVGRVVSLSNPAERARLVDAAEPSAHEDPGEASVAANAHARGLTVDQVAAVLDRRLSRNLGGLLQGLDVGKRNPQQLLGDLRHAVETEGRTPPVVVVDGLDEAGPHAFAMARDLLLPLARFARVIVATREMRHPDGTSLLGLLNLTGELLDLGSDASRQRGQEDLWAYVTRRLRDRDPLMSVEKVADLVAQRTTDGAGQPFLLARPVTSQLRDTPVDTTAAGWQSRVAASFEDAFAADLATVGAPPHRPGADGPVLARRLLTALTWALGLGFPMPEWATAAEAVGHGGPVTDEDLWWVLERLGRYVVQDGESEQAVYRLAHASFATWLRPTYAPTHTAPSDPAALPVATALAGRYQQLLGAGTDPRQPVFLWRYSWRYAALAGLPGLTMLRGLAAGHPDLAPDVATAGLEVSAAFHTWGYRHDAVTPTEEAAGLYRDLAATNPAFTPDLARALTNLGIRYSEVGRPHDAVAPPRKPPASTGTWPPPTPPSPPTSPAR